MPVEGRVNIEVFFRDIATTDGANSIKIATLTEAESKPAQAFAAFSGTVGTSAVTINPQVDFYRNAAGQLGGFDAERMAIKCSPGAFLEMRVVSIEQGDNTIYYTIPITAGITVLDPKVVDRTIQLRTVEGTGTAQYDIVFWQFL